MRPVRKLDILVATIHDDTRWQLTIVRSMSRSRSRGWRDLSLLAFILILVVVVVVRRRRWHRLPLFQSSCAARWGLLAPRSVTSAITYECPELLHLRAWHHFVACAAKHEHGDSRREFWCLSCAHALRQGTHAFTHGTPVFVFTLRYDSHFWWQRKENGPSQGIADGMSRGRDMNVFSTIIAVICVRSQPSALHACRRAVAYSFGVPICEVDCHCTSDGLAI